MGKTRPLYLDHVEECVDEIIKKGGEKFSCSSPIWYW